MPTTATTAALTATNIHAAVHARPILQGVNAQFAQGRWTSIVGPNGAGKSSLLKVLGGLWPAAQLQGDVALLGKDLQRWPRKQRAQALAWLGQGEVVTQELTVMDVAMLGRLPHQPWFAAPSSEDHALVEQCLRAAHAWDWRHRPVAELSGGERQRVLLARAMAVQAPVLLMDEPLANLDPPHQTDWVDSMRALTAQGTTVVSVLHEISVALLADHMLVLQAGRVLHQGRCDDPATHAALEAVFDHRIQVRAIDGVWMALPRTATAAQAGQRGR
ncbi:MAG: ABC transporter ATP-binding protein [Comamonas sp.]|jgi:iron complex transport system ATP-binding protein|nr:ABC transporter ATP-binding protein [Comamonas sp.]